MSTARSAANDGRSAAAAIKPESPEFAHDKLLKIPYSTAVKEEKEDLEQLIKPLYGALPKDEPFLSNFTALERDVRDIFPMTVRYLAAVNTEPESIPIYHQHEIVRLAIWRKMDELLPGLSLPERRPTVMLDYVCLGNKACRGIIDLTFTSWEGVKVIIKELADIEIEEQDGKSRRYIYDNVTNTLPANVYVLECLRLPVDSNNAKEVCEAFASITSCIGNLLGIGKVVTRSKKWGVEDSDNGILKVYIELPRERMADRWPDLVLKLPTHLCWHGIHYNLRYRGDYLHKKTVLSASFPILANQEGASGQEGNAAAAAAASKRPRSATPQLDSSNAAAKKAKPGEE